MWAAEITYIPMSRGFLYLVTIIDWYSRYVISWRLSNTLDADFCVVALEEALGRGTPDIFNTDQGSQFTDEAFTGLLKRHGVRISMDDKGSYNDNLFIERLWRTVKYEDVYLKAYQNGREARISLGEYFHLLQHQPPPPVTRLSDTSGNVRRRRREYLYQCGRMLGSKHCRNGRTLS